MKVFKSDGKQVSVGKASGQHNHAWLEINNTFVCANKHQLNKLIEALQTIENKLEDKKPAKKKVNLKGLPPEVQAREILRDAGFRYFADKRKGFYQIKTLTKLDAKTRKKLLALSGEIKIKGYQSPYCHGAIIKFFKEA